MRDNNGGGPTNPCSGTLNQAKQKKSDKSPDMWGYLKIDKHLLDFIKEEMDKGNDLPEIRLIGWRKEGNYGVYISLLADVKDVQGDPKGKSFQPRQQRYGTGRRSFGGGGKPSDPLPF